MQLTDLGALQLESARSHANLVNLLAALTMLERDAEVVGLLRTHVEASRYAVGLTERGPYAVFDDAHVSAVNLAGERPSLPIIDLPAALERDPRLSVAYYARLAAQRPRAELIVRRLAEHGAELSRSDFEAARVHAQGLAIEAYRLGAFIQQGLDQTRREIVLSQSTLGLRLYWEHIHFLSHLSLLAASAVPTSWLTDLAASFTWRTWTPSFPLVRERMVRLSVRGAWVSTKFGPEVVGPYLEVIHDSPLMRTFDAVISLVALAASHDSERRAIERALLRELRRRAHGEEREVVEALLRSAACVLTEPSEAARRTILLGEKRLARPASRAESIRAAIDRDDDAAEVDDQGYFPAILAMGDLATSPASVFFAETAARSSSGKKKVGERAMNAIARTVAVAERPSVLH